MMRGCLYIDGVDAYEEYGVFVTEGGWNELISQAPLKPVDFNEWQEEDGIEPDLSNPVLNTREVSIKVAISGLFSKFHSLVELLSDSTYHTFECVSILRKFRLRLVSVSSLSTAKALGVATLKLADDFPLHDYEYIPPSSTISSTNDYLFDGIRFSDYGVRILKGTFDEVCKTPNAKINLLRKNKSQAGELADNNVVTYKSKDVKLNCLMRADTLDELWRNYDALIYDLIRPNERTLWVDEIEQGFLFFYKQCQVTEFYPNGKIWLKFTLTIVFFGGARIDDKDIVLATENGIIISEEKRNKYIDMLPL